MTNKVTGSDGLLMANLSVMMNLIIKLQDLKILSSTEARELIDGPMLLIEKIGPSERDSIAQATYVALQQMLKVISRQ